MQAGMSLVALAWTETAGDEGQHPLSSQKAIEAKDAPLPCSGSGSTDEDTALMDSLLQILANASSQADQPGYRQSERSAISNQDTSWEQEPQTVQEQEQEPGRFLYVDDIPDPCSSSSAEAEMPTSFYESSSEEWDCMRDSMRVQWRKANDQRKLGTKIVRILLSLLRCP